MNIKYRQFHATNRHVISFTNISNKIINDKSLTHIAMYVNCHLTLLLWRFLLSFAGHGVNFLQTFTWHGISFSIFIVCHGLFSLVLMFSGLRIEPPFHPQYRVSIYTLLLKQRASRFNFRSYVLNLVKINKFFFFQRFVVQGPIYQSNRAG